MKKILALLLASCLISAGAVAQNAAMQADTAKQNGWYVEGGGQSIFGITFNYERYFSKGPGGFSFHIGFGGGYVPGFFDEEGLLLFGAAPAGLSYNIPISDNKQHFIELGVGVAALFAKDGGGVLGSLISGYRYQAPNGKLQIRATLIPIMFAFDEGGGAIPWIGFSIGKRF